MGIEYFCGCEGSDMVFKSNHLAVEVTRYWDLPYSVGNGHWALPGQRIGLMHYNSNIYSLKAEDDWTKYSKELYTSGFESIRKLAEVLQADREELRGLTVFGGFSRLAGHLTERFGFRTFPVLNPVLYFGVQIYDFCKTLPPAETDKEQWEALKKNKHKSVK